MEEAIKSRGRLVLKAHVYGGFIQYLIGKMHLKKSCWQKSGKRYSL